MVRQRNVIYTKSDEKCSLEKKETENGNVCTQNGISLNRTAGKSEISNYLRTPRILQSIIPYVFFFELLSVTAFGMLIGLPVLMGDTAIYHQIAGIIMLSEILINWYYMAYTDTSFEAAQFKPYDRLKIDRQSKKIPTEISNSKGKHPIESKHFEYNIFPYWSWSPCYRCDRWRPPRCHHCPLCNTCVLKRDHHCYFSRNCIGFQNQKYYIVFCIWSFISELYSLSVLVGHYSKVIWPYVTVFDLLPGFSFMRYVFIYEHGSSGFLVLIVWILIGLIVLTFMQIGSALHLSTSSLTAFEIEHAIDVKDTRSFSQILESVFGDMWYLNFILPLHGNKFAPKDDPFHWSYLQPPKKVKHIRVM